MIHAKTRGTRVLLMNDTHFSGNDKAQSWIDVCPRVSVLGRLSDVLSGLRNALCMYVCGRGDLAHEYWCNNTFRPLKMVPTASYMFSDLSESGALFLGRLIQGPLRINLGVVRTPDFSKLILSVRERWCLAKTFTICGPFVSFNVL